MPTKPRAVAQPDIRPRNALDHIRIETIEHEPTVENALIAGGPLVDSRLRNGLLEHSILDSIMVIEANADAMIVRHVRMERCDWSNSSIESASWTTTFVEGSKLTGAKLNRATLKDVTFRECRADFAQFQQAKLVRVIFENCNLKHAYFNDATMPKTVFSGCDLSEADFSHAKMKGCDLRRSRIDGIRIAPEQLASVIVTPDQALYLAGLLGLDIRD